MRSAIVILLLVAYVTSQYTPSPADLEKGRLGVNFMASEMRFDGKSVEQIKEELGELAAKIRSHGPNKEDVEQEMHEFIMGNNLMGFIQKGSNFLDNVADYLAYGSKSYQ